MTRLQKNFVHGSVATATVTGAVYAWMKYFMRTDDPFAVVNHPWQPSMLHLHVIVVPFLVFGLGWITSNHIAPKLRSGSRSRRRSGLVMIALGLVMIASGYLLQVLTSERALELSAILHWSSSAIFVAGYLVHQSVSPSAKD